MERQQILSLLLLRFFLSSISSAMVPNHQGVSVERPFAFTLAEPITTGSNDTEEEFDFWGASNCYNTGESEENELPVQAQLQTEGFWDQRPSLDGGSTIGNGLMNECSPLLPRDRNHSSTCNTSASQAIADGRRQLMQFAESLPESCYELSLKDIVDKGQMTPEIHEKSIIEENFHFHDKPQVKRRKKQKPAAVPRSESMESKNFMIKLFFPSCIIQKKKSGNNLEESLKPGVERFRNQESKGFFKGLFNIGFDKNNRRQNGTSSSSNNTNGNRSSSTYRHSSGSKLTGFLPFFGRRCRTREDEGCLF